jgi:predicted TIM-barrel fold metal-dependent hydrolase
LSKEGRDFFAISRIFWAEAQELDFSIGIHEGTGGMPAVGVDRFQSFGAAHGVAHDGMDRHFEDKALFNASPLTMAPSEYFQRQCWISYEPVEGNLSHLVDYVGPHKILWATDYPHPDGFFPGAPAQIAEKLSVNWLFCQEI